jgi:hypothetical protein
MNNFLRTRDSITMAQHVFIPVSASYGYNTTETIASVLARIKQVAIL